MHADAGVCLTDPRVRDMSFVTFNLVHRRRGGGLSLSGLVFDRRDSLGLGSDLHTVGVLKLDCVSRVVRAGSLL